MYSKGVLALRGRTLLQFPVEYSYTISKKSASLGVPSAFRIGRSRVTFRNFSGGGGVSEPLIVLTSGSGKFGSCLRGHLSRYFMIEDFSSNRRTLRMVYRRCPSLIVYSVVLGNVDNRRLSSGLGASESASFVPIVLVKSRVSIGQQRGHYSSRTSLFMYGPFGLRSLGIRVSVLVGGDHFLQGAFLRGIFKRSFLAGPVRQTRRSTGLTFLGRIGLCVVRGVSGRSLAMSSVTSEVYVDQAAFCGG